MLPAFLGTLRRCAIVLTADGTVLPIPAAASAAGAAGAGGVGGGDASYMLAFDSAELAATSGSEGAVRVQLTMTWSELEGVPACHVAACSASGEPMPPSTIVRWVNGNAARAQGLLPCDDGAGGDERSAGHGSGEHVAPAGVVAADVAYHPLTRTLCCAIHPCGVAAVTAGRGAGSGSEDGAGGSGGEGSGGAPPADSVLTWASLMLPLVGLRVEPRRDAGTM